MSARAIRRPDDADQAVKRGMRDSDEHHERVSCARIVRRALAIRMVGDQVHSSLPGHPSPRSETIAATYTDAEDNLRAARGLVYGVIGGLLFWTVFVVLVLSVFGS